MPLDRVAEALLERGATLVFPRVEGDRLVFHRAVPAELAPGYRGILEPSGSAPRVAVEAIDVFVVPGLLFDRSGRRLGRGSGFYDRTLARARADALRIGLCYAESVVDELPREEQDVDMHLIATDAGVLPVSAAHGR